MIFKCLKVSKIIFFGLILYVGTILVCQAKIGDILYVKYKYTPVLSSPNEEDQGMISFLYKGYIVVEQGSSGDYTKVKLTDNSNGYILKYNLGDNNSNEYNIGGNFGSTISNASLLDKPFLSSSNIIGKIEDGVIFNVLHVNYINNSYVKVKIINGKYKTQIGFIHKKFVKIVKKDGFKSDISLFIENNTVNNTNLASKNTDKEIEENGLNSAPVIPVKKVQSPKVDNTQSPKVDNTKNDSDEFMKSLGDLFNDESKTSNVTTPTPTPTQTQTQTPTPTTPIDDSDAFMKSLGELFAE